MILKSTLTVAITLAIYSASFATIDIAIKTPEYVVFASDGRVVHSGTTEIFSDTYEKIVQVSKYVIVQTAGAALPGYKNFKTTIQDFRWKCNLTDTSSIFIDSIINMFRQYSNSQERLGVDYTGFLVFFAGPDSLGNIKYVEYIPSADSLIHNDKYTVYWRGIENVIYRLLWGIDRQMMNSLQALMFKLNPDSSKQFLVGELVKIALDYNFITHNQVIYWSLQDAIDYAHLLVNATILIDRMTGGKYHRDQKIINPGTGGKILICAVTRDGVKWVLTPDYDQ